ncbi:hypothetical protein [Bradyrhizobium retamae]|nr:hypothetical protein [Bradyrhizobium retamae]
MDIFWLLFVVFFVPLSCLVLCLIQIGRGMYYGYCNRRVRRSYERRAFR